VPSGGGEEGSVPPGLLAAAERARGAGGQGGKGRRLKKGKGGRPKTAGLRLLTGILAAIAAGLVLVILAGTLYVLFTDPASFPGGASRAAAAGDNAEGASDSETGMFTGIGRLRIAAGSRATVVLSVVFPYPPADRPFTEELASKVPLFRQIARDYFGALSQDELDSLDEQKAKAEILRNFNNELRLGQIESLLFNDLLVLE
jgi:flagellar basal body-associated protein FliL